MKKKIDDNLFGGGLFGTVVSEPIVIVKSSRLSAPPILIGTAFNQRPLDAPKRKITPWINPFTAACAEQITQAAGQPITYTDNLSGVLGVDVECFENFFLICFKQFGTQNKRTFEQSDRSQLDKAAIAQLLKSNTIVSFNGMTYDLPMIYLALKGASCADLKFASNRIIQTGLKHWEIERELRISLPKNLDHIDLLESNPSVRQGLKMLMARLHGRYVVDLPYPEDAWLTPDQMNYTTLYCFNDLDATEMLYDAVQEPLELRRALSKEYNMDLRSKSDAQIGEAIVKKRVEDFLGRQVKKAGEPGEIKFKYSVPPFISFEDERMNALLRDLATTEFCTNSGGEVETPALLKKCEIEIGGNIYSMGIGGLHSQEAHRTVCTDSETFLLDIDVASQYPNIIKKLGLHPKALGPAFLGVYSRIIDERMAAKAAKDKVRIEGLKIALNGVYGKLGSPYSIIYAPEIMIAVTLTGQLSLLMLIERCEAIGAQIVSGNTDGVVVLCPKEKEAELQKIIAAWEADTGFTCEQSRYRAIYNSSVNTYIAVKEDGKIKRKGSIADPWADGDKRSMLSKNPQMTVCAKAVEELILKGVELETTIRSCIDPRMFLTATKVTGGAVWRGHKLGRIIRFYWSTDGDPILYVTNSKKVSKSDGAKPLVELTNTLPPDIDYDRYIAEARDLAIDLAVIKEEELL